MCTLRPAALRRMAAAGTALALLLAAPVLGAERSPPTGSPGKAGDDALGTRKYADYDKPQACAGCHVDITRQHEQAMMSQAFTHSWDEIEYFELARPARGEGREGAGVKAGCNGCHAPLAFLAGDVPPKRPAAGTRANEARLVRRLPHHRRPRRAIRR